MDFPQAVILSIVEGVTEFLPISSTGHLILTSELLQIPQTEFVKNFEIFIQLGAILAVVVIYWKSLLPYSRVWKNIIAAFIPTAIIGFALYKFIKSYLIGNSLVTVLALLIGGILLIVLEKIYEQSSQMTDKEKKHHVSSIENLTIKQSFLIGLAQSVSVIPGVSRSAATILGAMFLGAKRQVAVEFSFLLAVPTMVAATSLDLIKSDFNFTTYEWSILMVGLIGSFVTAIIVIKWFISYVQKNTFVPFGIYRIIIALLFWFFMIR